MKLCMYQGKMYNILFTKESLSLLHNIAYSTNGCDCSISGDAFSVTSERSIGWRCVK